MKQVTRREFFEYSGKLAAMMGLSVSCIPSIADAITWLSQENPPVLWLQGQSCSGCSVSFLNSENPEPAHILIRHISLLFHSTISSATGSVALETMQKSISRSDYILVVEGSIPQGMPEACMVGHESINQLVFNAAKNAKAIVTAGTCASFGGIPAAENNPTGATSVSSFLESRQLSKPIIHVPGCPCHPDWIVGTLVHTLKFGIPKCDAQKRPLMFFSRLVHDQCPRFADYEREKFAKTFSERGCLFKLGCLGPNTHADCTMRFWNGGINSCITAGAPCIGCASETFALKNNFSFYRKNETS